MTENTHYIVLIQENVWKSWARDASTLTLFAGLIGFGVFLESTAMQWAGFLVAALATFARAGSVVKRMTIAEAREFLDQLEQRDDA